MTHKTSGPRGAPNERHLVENPKGKAWWGTSWLWAKCVVDNTESSPDLFRTPLKCETRGRQGLRPKRVVGQSEAGSQREQDRDKRAAPICFA
eukprot:2108477-Amphidinium_carterae.2